MQHRHQAFLSISLALVACIGCSGDESQPPAVGGGAGSPGSGGNIAGAGSPGSGGNVAGAGSGGTAGAPSAGHGGSQSTGGSGAGLGGTGAGTAGKPAGGQGGSQAGFGGAGQAGGVGGALVGGRSGAGAGPVSDAPPDLYEYYCVGCHGIQGAGSPTYGPEIQHPVHDYSLWVARHGLPGEGFREPMEPLDPTVLSDAALEGIFDWLDEPAQPTTGEALYLDYCGNCHGADGAGGPTMRPILEELGELESLVREGAHLGEFEMRREYMPAWNSTQLSDAEVDLIYAYVESL